MIHLMMNLKKTQMRMSSPSSLTKSARYRETIVGLSGEALQEECPGTRRIDESSIVNYECKKLDHFKSECPNLEKF